MMKLVALMTHPSSLLHDMGRGHPESPQRLHAIETALSDAGLLNQLQRLEAPAASDAQLLRAHTALHLHYVAAHVPQQGLSMLDADTALCAASLTAARHAAGAAVAAVDAVLAGQVTRAFCAVRPPGHHAESGRAMGFCVFNNIAIAARHAVAQHGLQRVAVIDFDVHHGNGTEEILADDPAVLMLGLFQSPLYPYSGELPLATNICNKPLPAGSDGSALRTLWESEWLPALTAFAPQLLLISAGFDAHRDDPLAGLSFVEDDYAWITEQLCAFADVHCQGRVVASLEGGYHLAALGRSVAAHIQALLR